MGWVTDGNEKRFVPENATEEAWRKYNEAATTYRNWDQKYILAEGTENEIKYKAKMMAAKAKYNKAYREYQALSKETGIKCDDYEVVLW